jgi:probable RNA-binding protein EIF1AD
VVAGRGNNLHEVRDHQGEAFLVSMPPKFRKNVWIKRGCFVVVKPIEEGDKVKAEILTILYKEQIKYIKAEKLWPVGFEAAKVEEEEAEACRESGDSEDESDIFQNTNRPTYEEPSEEETDSSEAET